MSLRTAEDIKKLLPSGTNKKVTDKIVELVSTMGEEVGVVQEYMEEMFTRNINVIKGGDQRSLEKYVEALKYVSLKMRPNMTNKDAWKTVFPDRFDALVQNGRLHQLEANVSMYNRRPMVVDIEAQMMLDFNVFYSWARHEAMMHQVGLMRGEASPTTVPKMEKNPDTGKKEIVYGPDGEPVMETIYMKVSPTVQQLASRAILDITEPEKEKNVNIRIGMSDEAIEQQKETSASMRSLAESMREAMINGANIEDVQVIGHVISGEDNDTK